MKFLIVLIGFLCVTGAKASNNNDNFSQDVFCKALLHGVPAEVNSDKNLEKVIALSDKISSQMEKSSGQVYATLNDTKKDLQILTKQLITPVVSEKDKLLLQARLKINSYSLFTLAAISMKHEEEDFLIQNAKGLAAVYYSVYGMPSYFQLYDLDQKLFDLSIKDLEAQRIYKPIIAAGVTGVGIFFWWVGVPRFMMFAAGSADAATAADLTFLKTGGAGFSAYLGALDFRENEDHHELSAKDSSEALQQIATFTRLSFNSPTEYSEILLAFAEAERKSLQNDFQLVKQKKICSAETFPLK